MIRTVKAELVKLLRARVAITAGVAAVVFAAGSAALVLAAVEPAGPGPQGRAPTLLELADAGGGTAVFATAVSFVGTFLFVVFAGAFAAEFSRGTIRTMLLRQPSRLRLLAGKMIALLAFAGAVLAIAAATTWVAAWAMAPSQGVATTQWTSIGALGAGLADFGRVMLWVTGYAGLAMALAVIVRNVPVTLAIAIAWAGPFEHLLQDGWETASRVFPGLLLKAFVAGGTPEVSATHALLLVVAYTTGAVAVAGLAFAHRDVSA